MDIRAEQKAELARRNKQGVKSELSESAKAEMAKAVRKKQKVQPTMAPEKKSRLEQLAASVVDLRDDATNYVKGKMEEIRHEQTEAKRRNVDKAVEGK